MNIAKLNAWKNLKQKLGSCWLEAAERKPPYII